MSSNSISLLKLVWLQAKLNSTQSCYHYLFINKRQLRQEDAISNQLIIHIQNHKKKHFSDGIFWYCCMKYCKNEWEMILTSWKNKTIFSGIPYYLLKTAVNQLPFLEKFCLQFLWNLSWSYLAFAIVVSNWFALITSNK